MAPIGIAVSVALTVLAIIGIWEKDNEKFFNNFLVKLTGTKDLEQQIKDGISEKEIRKSWEPKLNEYKKIRNRYLIY